MINLRYFCFVVIQLYLKVRALALFYFINLHHYTYITNCQNKIHRNSGFSSNPDVFKKYPANIPAFPRSVSPRKRAKTNKIHRNSTNNGHPDVFKKIPANIPTSPRSLLPRRSTSRVEYIIELWYNLLDYLM